MLDEEALNTCSLRLDPVQHVPVTASIFNFQCRLQAVKGKLEGECVSPGLGPSASRLQPRNRPSKIEAIWAVILATEAPHFKDTWYISTAQKCPKVDYVRSLFASNGEPWLDVDMSRISIRPGKDPFSLIKVLSTSTLNLDCKLPSMPSYKFRVPIHSSCLELYL